MQDYKLSILIHGKESERPRVNAMNLVLQDQLNELGNVMGISEIEAYFYLHDEKDDIKRKKYCLAHTWGKYYTEIKAPFVIRRTYLRELWFNLNTYENDEEALAEKGIFKRKPWQINKNLPFLRTIGDAEEQDENIS